MFARRLSPLRRSAGAGAAANARSSWAAQRPRAIASGVIPGVPKKLEDIVKLDLLEKADASQVLHVWATHHAEKAELAGAAAEAAEYETLVQRGAESPSFVWPVRRDGGHMMMYSQYAPAHQMFVYTFLEDYRRSPELSPPWMSVLLFDDLLDTKGVALLRAEALALTHAPHPSTGAPGLTPWGA